MALVGPRPAIEYELEYYEPIHFERFDVRPGTTGLWQVSARSAIAFTEMLDLDAEYARSASFATDVRILLRTPAPPPAPRLSHLGDGARPPFETSTSRRRASPGAVTGVGRVALAADR